MIVSHLERQEGAMRGHCLHLGLDPIQSARSLFESLLKVEVTSLKRKHVLKLTEIYSELFEIWVSKSFHQFFRYIINLNILLQK